MYANLDENQIHFRKDLEEIFDDAEEYLVDEEEVHEDVENAIKGEEFDEAFVYIFMYDLLQFELSYKYPAYSFDVSLALNHPKLPLESPYRP